MPTGYTSDLYEGDQTFAEFAMTCARAFGALIEMRDLPMDSPVPEEFTPSPYHAERLAQAEATVERARLMTDDEAQQLADLDYTASVQRIEKARRDADARRARYEDMVARVERWEPPTADHVEMKKFMLDQLTESIKFDCGTKYLTPPDRVSGREYRRNLLAKATKDIEYHTEKLAEDRERAEKRTAWVSALRDSLAVQV